MKLKPSLIKTLVAFVTSLILAIAISNPSFAHWADLSVAEILIESQSIEINLTFPTGMIDFADSDRDGKISFQEFTSNQAKLTQFIGAQIQIKDENSSINNLRISYQNDGNKNNQITAPNTSHTSLKLLYSAAKKINQPTINYQFFLPNVSTATCLATILANGKGEQFIFSPSQTSYSISDDIPQLLRQNLWLAIAGAFIWGGMHALSPGHGKTLVAAYLVGEKATWSHALILGVTTTVTHTIGVIIMGGIALLATQFFSPEAIFPWLSLLAGLSILVVGLHLLWQRCFARTNAHRHTHEHTHTHDRDHFHKHLDRHEHYHSDRTHDHSHSHSQNHGHDHDHGHSHDHIHSFDSWQQLITLGIASGLTPCPAALVILLGAISLKQIGLGISLVLCFSVGLAIVLSSLGIVLVSAKNWFQRLPISPKSQIIFPIASAVIISAIGIFSTVNSLQKIIS